MADVWANSMACHPRATCHTAGCCHLANSMSWSLSYVSHCRVLPPGSFTVMIPELLAALQGAATWRIQWRVIPEPRVTLQGRHTATWWTHCHDPRATYQIAWCKNSIRQSKIRFSPYFILFFGFLNAVRALTSGGFRMYSIHLLSLCSLLLSTDSYQCLSRSRNPVHEPRWSWPYTTHLHKKTERRVGIGS